MNRTWLEHFVENLIEWKLNLPCFLSANGAKVRYCCEWIVRTWCLGLHVSLPAGLISEAEQMRLVTKTEEETWKHTTNHPHTLIIVYNRDIFPWETVSVSGSSVKVSDLKKKKKVCSFYNWKVTRRKRHIWIAYVLVVSFCHNETQMWWIHLINKLYDTQPVGKCADLTACSKIKAREGLW